MENVVGYEPDGTSNAQEPWDGLLADAGPRDHIVQTCGSETSAKNLNIQLDLQADNDLVNADPARLQQTFWNLLRNAAKFTSEGGEYFYPHRKQWRHSAPGSPRHRRGH